MSELIDVRALFLGIIIGAGFVAFLVDRLGVWDRNK
jgi:hypothetical protein